MLGLLFVFQFLMARFLGAANLGIYALAQSLVTIFGTLSLLGLPVGLIRFITYYNGLGEKDVAIGSVIISVIAGLVSSVIFAGALVFSSDFVANNIYHNSEVAPILRVLSISLPFTTLMTILLVIPQALKQVIYQVIIGQVITPLLKVISLIIVVALISKDLIPIVWSVVFATIVAFALTGWVILHLLRSVYRHVMPRFLSKALFLFSWPLLFMDLIHKALQEVQTIILGAFLTSDLVGIYFVAFRVSTLLSIFLSSFSLIFAPIMGELYSQHDDEQLAYLFKVVTKWGLALCLPIFLWLFIFAQEILSFLGSDFVNGAVILQILLLAQIVNVCVGASGWMLTMTGHTHINLFNAIATFVLSMFFALIMIPHWGIIGASFSMALSLSLINILRLIEVYYYMRIHPYERSYLKPMIAFATAVFTSLIIKNILLPTNTLIWLLISFIPISFVYVTTLLLLGLSEPDLFVVNKLRFAIIRLIKA